MLSVYTGNNPLVAQPSFGSVRSLSAVFPQPSCLSSKGLSYNVSYYSAERETFSRLLILLFSRSLLLSFSRSLVSLVFSFSCCLVLSFSRYLVLFFSYSRFSRSLVPLLSRYLLRSFFWSVVLSFPLIFLCLCFTYFLEVLYFYFSSLYFMKFSCCIFYLVAVHLSCTEDQWRDNVSGL